MLATTPSDHSWDTGSNCPYNNPMGIDLGLIQRYIVLYSSSSPLSLRRDRVSASTLRARDLPVESRLLFVCLLTVKVQFFWILESEKVLFGNFRAIWSNFGLKMLFTGCTTLLLFDFPRLIHSFVDCLFVCSFVYLFICSFVCLLVYLFICLFVCV